MNSYNYHPQRLVAKRDRPLATVGAQSTVALEEVPPGVLLRRGRNPCLRRSLRLVL